MSEPSADLIRRRLADLIDRLTSLVGAAPSVAAAAGLPGAYFGREDVDGLLVDRPRLPAVLEPEGRLARLAETFGLDAVDVALLIVGAAPELDGRFERLFGWAQDDLTRGRAGAELALLLCACDPADPDARRRLLPGSALVDGALVELGQPERPFPSRPLHVPDRVVSWLLGDEASDALLVPLLVPELPVPREDGSLASAIEAGALLTYIVETPGSDPRALACGALRGVGLRPLVVDLDRLATTHDVLAVARAALREARLQGSALVIGPVQPLVADGPRPLRSLVEATWPVVVHGLRSWDPAWSRAVPHIVRAEAVRSLEQVQLWSELLGDAMPPEDIAAATATFRLTGEQVNRAATAAVLSAATEARPVEGRDLRLGARRQNSAALESLAARISPRATWDDLIVPDGTRKQLEEIVDRSAHRDLVYREWGLAGTGHRGDGLTALFAGPSGTGKTLAAEVVAGALGLELYLVDLSMVVDKYIGETEKHLDRIFGEAERVNGVLFFDEADALFGKRSEVKDSRDRYANLEVAYLLQRMEAFSGTAMLTTNLRSNLDEAFLRRLDTVITFPQPDVAARKLLWARFFRNLPVAEDVDLDFCAERFELTGANIRSVAVAAAFRAASTKPPVLMEDIIDGIQREYRKLGRLCHESEFGPYADLLRDERE